LIGVLGTETGKTKLGGVRGNFPTGAKGGVAYAEEKKKKICRYEELETTS